MHRPGRLTSRARWTSCGTLTTKLNKNLLYIVDGRARRGAIAPRRMKRTGNPRRVVSTVDVVAFSSAIRGAAMNLPLFHKTGVMRYDPLKKNVVRPFRALFNLVFGVVRGVVQSALTFGMAPIQMFPIGKYLDYIQGCSLKSKLKSLPSMTPSMRKVASCQEVKTLESHPLRCHKRTDSEFPSKTAGPRHRRVRTMDGSSKEISDVLKAYNTSQSRDRLISKLESMKSSAAECIKNLSQRNTEQPSLTRRELLACKQEMVQLSKQLSGLTADRRSSSKDLSRSQSVMQRPRSSVAVETSGRNAAPLQRAARRSLSQASHPIRLESLTERVKEEAQKNKESSPARTRSENLRMKLKQHEHMVDSLRSKYAALRPSQRP